MQAPRARRLRATRQPMHPRLRRTRGFSRPSPRRVSRRRLSAPLSGHDQTGIPHVGAVDEKRARHGVMEIRGRIIARTRTDIRFSIVSSASRGVCVTPGWWNDREPDAFRQTDQAGAHHCGHSSSENGLSAPSGGTSGCNSNGSQRVFTPSFVAACSTQVTDAEITKRSNDVRPDQQNRPYRHS